MKSILPLAFLAFIVMACAEDDDKFFFRLENETGFILENVKVTSISGEEHLFGTIENQQYSNYESFISLSRDSQVDATLNNKHYTHLPLINIWSGPPLDPGKYTYTLNEIDTALLSFSLQFSKD